MTDQQKAPDQGETTSESLKRSRKEIKHDAVIAAREQRQAKKALKSLPSKERKAAEAAAKEANKQAETARKAARKEMPRAERRADKREARIFRKVAHRGRRAIGWGIAAIGSSWRGSGGGSLRIRYKAPIQYYRRLGDS